MKPLPYKKIIVFAVVLILLSAGIIYLVTTDNLTNFLNKNNNNEETNSETNSSKGLDYFETEVLKIDSSLEKTEVYSALINAKDGYKLKNENDNIEIYKFDKSSSNYKEAEKNLKFSLSDGFEIYPEEIKNGYAIFIEKDYKYYNQVMDIFYKLN